MTILTTYLFTMLMALGQAQSSSGLVITSGDLTLRLSAENTALRVEERPVVHVTVTNNGSDTLTLVQPGDGSESGWRTPIIAWSVIESSSDAKHPPEPTPHPGPRMCGNINALRLDEVFDLAPGETKELKGWVYLEPFKEPGVYKVVFQYANRPSLEWKGIPLGEHDKMAMWFIRLSIETTLSSNELVFTVGS